MAEAAALAHRRKARTWAEATMGGLHALVRRDRTDGDGNTTPNRAPLRDSCATEDGDGWGDEGEGGGRRIRERRSADRMEARMEAGMAAGKGDGAGGGGVDGEGGAQQQQQQEGAAAASRWRLCVGVSKGEGDGFEDSEDEKSPLTVRAEGREDASKDLSSSGNGGCTWTRQAVKRTDVEDDADEVDCGHEGHHKAFGDEEGLLREDPSGSPLSSSKDDGGSDSRCGGLKDEEVEKDEDEEVLKYMFERVLDAKEQLDNYKNALVFLAFVVMYFAMLCLQADSTRSYEVALGHDPLKPQGFDMGEASTFSSMTEFYSWLNDSIIQSLWQDPVCGNGICERPLEFEAFGNLGCEADCGSYKDVTTITVSMRTNFETPAMMRESSWNLCMSEPLELCWFEENQAFEVQSGHVLQQFSAPDGDWAVVLNLPHGGARGMVLAPLPTVSRLDVMGTPQSDMLVSWGDCVPARESKLLHCRAVCARLVECLQGMDCANGLSQASASTAYVDCANDCSYSDPIALQYENATCSKVSEVLAMQMFANVNCSGTYSQVGVDGGVHAQPRTVEHFRSVRRRAFGYTTGAPTTTDSSSSSASATAGATQTSPATTDAATNAAAQGDPSHSSAADAVADAAAYSPKWRRTSESALAAAFQEAPGNTAVKAVTASEVAAALPSGAAPPPTAEALPEAVTWFETVKLFDQQKKKAKQDVGSEVSVASSNGKDGSSSSSSRSSLSSMGALDAAASLAAMFAGNGSGGSFGSTNSTDSTLSALSVMWRKLGFVDDQRLANVQVAVARLLYAAYGEKCLTEYVMNITVERRQRLTAFFCTLFGGPFGTRQECNYTEAMTGQQVTDFVGLYNALLHEHKGRGLLLSQEHMEHWVEMVVAAFESVTDLDEATLVQLEWIMHAFNGAVVTPGATGCNLDGTVLMWMQGEQQRSNIQVGDKITWVWGDDSPQSIMYAGFGDPVEPIFKGFGSNRLVVSRNTRCDTKGIHGYNASTDPSPCVLRSRKDTSAAFTYTVAFDRPGTIFYVGGRFGSSMSGVVNILPLANASASLSEVKQFYPGLMAECRPECPYKKLADGQCNAACNNPACGFDGGDCACTSPNLDFPHCECSSGQTRDFDGSCCDSAAIGEALRFPFRLRYYGDNLTETMKAVHGRNAALNRFISSKESGSGYTLSLRLLMGMFIFQERREGVPCPTTRLVEAVPWCKGQVSTKPFGVNPHFLQSSSLYDPEVATNLADHDTSNFSQPIVFRKPGIPYGFQFPEERNDYPLIFDINLDNRAATRRLQYLVDGFFVDNNTRTITVAFLTYNGETRSVTLTRVVTKVGLGGGLPVTYEVRPVSVQLYSTQSADVARLVLEVLWVLAVLWNVVEEVLEMLRVKMTTGAVVVYFQRLWNWMDLLNLGIQIVCIALWIDMAVLADQVNSDIHYDVYTSLTETPYYWSMPNPPTAYEVAMAEYGKIEYLVYLRNIYFVLQGINLMLITMRLLKLLDFQPYLGIITRSIHVAAPAITHFFLLWLIIFSSFALFGYLIFGPYMQEFSTVAESMLTCFLIIINENKVFYVFIRLEGWLHVAGIIFMLVFNLMMVFILLNLLIAIIVEAFMEVKDGDAGREPTTIVDDVVGICKHAKLMASTRTWRYSTLLNQLYSLSNSNMRLTASASMKKRPASVIAAMVQGMWNRKVSTVGDVHRVIRINDRKLEYESVNTVLQRSVDRSKQCMVGVGSKRAKWSGAGVMTKAVDTKKIDVPKMSDTLVGLLGQQVEVKELPESDVPNDSGDTTSGTKADAKKKYTLRDIHDQIRHISSDSRHTLHHMLEKISESNEISLTSLREEMRQENERALMQVKEDIQRETEKMLSILLRIQSQLPQGGGSSISRENSRTDGSTQ